jgi:hypothetical protein
MPGYDSRGGDERACRRARARPHAPGPLINEFNAVRLLDRIDGSWCFVFDIGPGF